jgi:branched-chain amino acid transport system permease protein
MPEFTIFIYQIAFSIGLLVLISTGLAVIFGMMKVINLAQGEFIMLGAYFALLGDTIGLPFIFSVLLAMVGVGLFGVLVERLLVRFLYGRLMDTLLATWGLSLLMIGVVTTVLGPQAAGVSVETGRLAVGDVYSISVYNLYIIGVAFAALAACWMLWHYTRFGLVARAVMANPDMTSALGVDCQKYYMLTFGIGSALSGLAGAMLAPIVGTQPTMGGLYVAQSFVSVISGGELPFLGTLLAGGLFGTTNGILSYAYSQVFGEIGVFLLAIVLLRFLPQGMTHQKGRTS